MIAQCFVELVGNLMKWVSPAPDMISVVDSDKGREQTVKLGGGCMTIMERMALRLEGPTFSLHTSRGTSTACAICTQTHTHIHRPGFSQQRVFTPVLSLQMCFL